jgi:hypothetical protein
MTKKDPYLSIVAVSRNDDHGGKLLQRMQLFVDSLFYQCNKYEIPSELILVEWNPPANKESLSQALNWPELREYITTRIITVPPSIHNTFAHSEGLPVFQMIGKNVGIRRAKGEFVLATNIDILFSDEMMQNLSIMNLKNDMFYRADRIDIDPSVMDHPFDPTITREGQKNILRKNVKYGSYENHHFIDNFKNLMQICEIYLYRKKIMRDYKFPLLHTNGCGDFTLMAKRMWEDLYGYAEFEMYSFHIDSLLLVAASYSGFKEVYLKHPKEIFHIEHQAGSGWTPGKGETLLFERMEKNKIPYLSWEDFLQYSREIANGKYTKDSFIRFNKASWGLQTVQLPEMVIS